MLVVLSMVVLISMLGFMGIEMAGRDTQVSGTYLDISSRDQAAISGNRLAIARLSSNAARTVAQLQNFVADSSRSLSATHQYLVLSQAACSLQVADPGYYALGSNGDLSAAKVQVVSVDLGSATTGSTGGAGIKLTLNSSGRGRNGDIVSQVSTYQILGVDVPATASATSPTLDFAVYINGALSNTNFGANVTGNVYVNGPVSTNSSAPIAVTGALRVNGALTSNASLTVAGNAVVAGDVYTNGSAPITIQQNAVIQGGINTMNASLTVNGSLEVDKKTTYGSWNSGANLVVGGQFWDKAECRDILGNVTISGPAYFDSCMSISANGTSSFANLYVGRNGNSLANAVNNGTVNVSGAMGVWNSSTTNSFVAGGGTVVVSGNAIFKQPVNQTNSGYISTGGSAQFFQGISNIGNSNALGGIRVGGTTYLHSADQHGAFNGGVSLGNDLTMSGTADADFGQNGAPSRWFFKAGAPSTKWNYEAASKFTTGADPRVTGSSTNNSASYKGASGSQAVPADLFTAPAPVAATAYAANPLSAQDLDLTQTQAWNQSMWVDSTKLKPVWTVLTDARCSAAGASTNNWTASDFAKIYNKYKQANGWLIMEVGSSCSLGSLSAPAGTWSGKAIWIIDKSISVNGNWPASATTSDLQMLYVRGAGSLGLFGSPGNFAGYLYFENTFNGQMSWGGGAAVTFTGSMNLRGASASLTGNGGNLLTVNGSQTVIDQLTTAVPGILVAGGAASSGSSTSGSTMNIVLRPGRLQFRQIGQFR